MTLVTPQIIQSGSNYHVQHGTDAGLYVEFEMRPVLNQEKTDEAGRPIYEDKEYITIRIAGDTKTVRVRPVRLTDDGSGVPTDDIRWPRQYQAFKLQQQQVMDGTPLTEWSLITKSDAMSMKALNIHTVEQLAALGENNMNWLGARMMKEKAVAWLNQAQDNAGISQLQAENERLKNDIDAMKNQMAALIEAKPELAEKRKPGRPPKQDIVNGEDVS